MGPALVGLIALLYIEDMTQSMNNTIMMTIIRNSFINGK